MNARQIGSAPRFALVALLLCTPPRPLAAEVASSASFVLQQATLNGGGTTVSSPSFAVASSAGQESAIGVSSSPHALLQSGFWSWSGTGLVPVLLTMRKNAGDPSHYDADWTGNAPPYLVYRSTACADVFSAYLATSLPNDWTDVAPPPEALACYNVLATAPGPTPPPLTPESATEAGNVETLRPAGAPETTPTPRSR